MKCIHTSTWQPSRILMLILADRIWGLSFLNSVYMPLGRPTILLFISPISIHVQPSARWATLDCLIRTGPQNRHEGDLMPTESHQSVPSESGAPRGLTGGQ